MKTRVRSEQIIFTYICSVNFSKFGPPQSKNKKTAHLWTFLSDIRTVECFLLHSFLVGKTSAHCGSNSLALFLILSENGSRRHCKKKSKSKTRARTTMTSELPCSFTKKVSKLVISIAHEFWTGENKVPPFYITQRH